MAQNRRLSTDADFQEALVRKSSIRIFQNDHIVGSGGSIIRFDDSLIVIQSGLSEIAYYDRGACEFFEMRSR